MDTTLIILRGNSGSGKSSVARELRKRARTKTALVEQDYLRRIMLKEKDVPGGVNIGLIRQTVEYALSHEFNVIVEGILAAKRYRTMLLGLIEQHVGQSHIYYFDVSLEETLRRHQTKSNSHEFGEKELREWYSDHDALGVDWERILPETSTFEQIVERILQETGL